MCGILAIHGLAQPLEVARQEALSMAKTLRHRGPDWSGVFADDQAILAHERLAIVDPTGGSQPLIDTKTGRVLAVNGEIYNHVQLRSLLKKEHDFQTDSDCEVILYLYDEYGPECVCMLSGIFAFTLYDPTTKELFVARDHIGIIPLYVGKSAEGELLVASEMKAIESRAHTLKEFPPGTYYLTSQDTYTKWYTPKWMTAQPSTPVDITSLHDALKEAVRSQLMSDVPYGVLISGGLDSSLIAALAAKHSRRRVETQGEQEAWWPRLHSFSVGLDGSPDLAHARTVAQHLDTVHHEITFTVQEGLDALSDVIYHLETYDVTTIRAATPMYLMARKIRSLGIKMVLSGEGADEVFGGYLYFHMAPDAKEFYEETVRKLTQLSTYDCLRANKAMSAWGVEARVPFLDKEFLEVAMSIRAEDKMCSGDTPEKKILRQAGQGLIPDSVLWRQKEQFSDGVGYGWIDHLKAVAHEKVSDEVFADREKHFPIGTPQTKEAYWYRTMFAKHFPSDAAASTVPSGPSIACSTPTALKWSKSFEGMADPSGRAVAGVHTHAVDKV